MSYRDENTLIREDGFHVDEDFFLKDERNELREENKRLRDQLERLKRIQNSRSSRLVRATVNCIKGVSSPLTLPKEYYRILKKIDSDSEAESKPHKAKHNRFDIEKLAETLPRPVLANRPLVSIIVITHNGVDKVRKLCESLMKHRFYDNYEMVFVDNGSTDGTAEYIKSLSLGTEKITILRNEDNRTFSAANNQAVHAAKGEWLVFLNNDVEVLDGWLDELLAAAFEHEDAGAIGARLIYPEIRDKNATNYGRSFLVQHAGIGFCRKTVPSYGEAFLPFNKGQDEEGWIETPGDTQTIGAVTAACLLIRRTTFDRICGFDEQYNYGYEDVDLCLKAWRAGYKNYYVPKAILFHYEFGTQDKDAREDVIQRRKLNKIYFSRRWDTWLRRRILEDKLHGTAYFSNEPISVAFALPGIEDDPMEEAVSALAEKLKKQGVAVKYLWNESNTANWYTVGAETDILVSLHPEYNPARIRDRSSLLITAAWACKTDESWISSNYTSRYALFFASEESVREYLERILHRDVVLLGKDTNSQERIDEQQGDPFFHALDKWLRNRKKAVEILICPSTWVEAATWGDYYFAEFLRRALVDRGWQAEIRVRSEWYKPFAGGYSLMLRGVTQHVPNADRISMIWNISHPERVSFNEFKSYDIDCVASGKYSAELNEAGIPAVELPQCADKSFYRPPNKKEKRYDLLFIANTRGVERDIIRKLLPTDYNLAVYGKGWETMLSPQQICGRYVSNRDLPDTYNEACIVLNDHWDDMREKGFANNRIYDALAAGSFVISDRVDGMDPELIDSIETYSERSDLLEKVSFYMEHPEKRAEKAAKGQQYVLGKHTFEHRAGQIIALFECAARETE